MPSGTQDIAKDIICKPRYVLEGYSWNVAGNDKEVEHMVRKLKRFLD